MYMFFSFSTTFIDYLDCVRVSFPTCLWFFVFLVNSLLELLIRGNLVIPNMDTNNLSPICLDVLIKIGWSLNMYPVGF